MNHQTDPVVELIRLAKQGVPLISQAELLHATWPVGASRFLTVQCSDEHIVAIAGFDRAADCAMDMVVLWNSVPGVRMIGNAAGMLKLPTPLPDIPYHFPRQYSPSPCRENAR